MENEDRIVELLAESLRKQDRMADEVHALGTGMDSRFEQMDKRFERIESLLERLAIGFNEFVDIHRETVKAQHDRIGNLERRVDRLEGKS
jgi:archaellum component FlaC